MPAETIKSRQAPPAIGPYVQAVKAEGWVYVSGQIPLDPVTGEVVGQTIEEQTERVIQNLRAIVRSAGGDLGNVVKTTVYLKDLNEYAKMNEAYAKGFGRATPARATVEVSNLPKGVKIEIDAVAHVP